MNTIQEFTRNFLLHADPLDVYHPDNENSDEYDEYITYTILALHGNMDADEFAQALLFVMLDDYSHIKNKNIPSIAKKFERAKVRYNRRYKR